MSYSYNQKSYTGKHSSNPYINTVMNNSPNLINPPYNANTLYTHNLSNHNNLHNINTTTYNQHSSSKVPQTLLHPSPTPHKQTLIRNQSFENRLYNQDLIQLIAKIRSLQDDLINQKFKTQSLQRKIIDYQKIIDNLQYQLNQQSYTIQKYHHQIQLSNQKNIQIIKYQQNLKIVGEQIQQLNNVLINKNKQFQQISNKNKQLQYEIKKVNESYHLVMVNHNMIKKELEYVIQQYEACIDQIRGNIIGYNNKDSEQRNNQQNNYDTNKKNRNISNHNSEKNNNQTNNNPKKHTSNNNNRPPNNPKQINCQDILKLIQHIKSISTQYNQQIKYQLSIYQNNKKQLSTLLIKQKQKYIKLQYQFKLIQERIKDNSKKNDLISSYYNQQKVEEIINQLINKEDNYIKRIEELSQENDSLKEQLANIQNTNQYLYKVDEQQNLSVVQNLKKQINFLQTTIQQLTNKLRSTQVHYQSILQSKLDQIQLQQQNCLKLTKKSRKIQQQNYHYQIKIQQLTGQINLLQKQLAILKNQNQQQPQQLSQ